ncbi:hypothetical protein C8R44DRAFT_741587 [Mycena epipterygia]|nr:hypothetical protein C8R44DRAFT_741587 [Mycena epipterygia]
MTANLCQLERSSVSVRPHASAPEIAEEVEHDEEQRESRRAGSPETGVDSTKRTTTNQELYTGTRRCSQPTSDGDEMMNGSPAVCLHDSAAELEPFLRAILDSSYFMPPAAAVEFHSVLDGGITLDLKAIPILQEVGASWLLPFAFYSVGTYTSKELLGAGKTWDDLFVFRHKADVHSAVCPACAGQVPAPAPAISYPYAVRSLRVRQTPLFSGLYAVPRVHDRSKPPGGVERCGMAVLERKLVQQLFITNKSCV